MAVTVLCGFELNAIGAEPLVGNYFSFYGTAAYSTTQKRTGAYAMRCNPGSGASGYVYAGSIAVGYAHFGLYIATLPSVSRVIYGSSGFPTELNVRLNSDGTLSVYLNATLVGSSSALQTGGWYWIGVNYTNSSASRVLLQVDGQNAVSGSPVTSGASHVAYVGCTGTEASAIDFYIDDFILDSAGFLAPSKVSLLLPTADSSPYLWQGGAGGSSNIFEAVNNIPPAGVASASETDTTNIEAPGGNGSPSGIFAPTWPTYDSISGLTAASQILGILPFLRHGEDIATGSKSGNYILWNNPDQSGYPQSFFFGDDAGAHAAEAGQWKTLGLVYAGYSGITVTGSPDFRVTRTGDESRTACVDFMGIYVAWTPQTGTEAPAGLATATGSALAPARIEVAAFAGLAAATGAALVASVVSGKFVDAGLATATGTALTAAVGVGKVAGLATATGTALAATAVPERRAAAGQATATGTALAPTARPEARAPAGLAAGTGAALGPVAAVAVFGPLATATGSALTITVSVMENVRPAAGLATATGAALAGTPAVASFASTATAAGAALVATVSIQEGVTETKVYPDTAQATGAALTASVLTEARASAGLATATGAALTPTARPEARAGAGLAVSTGSALAPTASIAPFAATATATGAALTATATPTQFVYVDALTATAAGSALAPSTYAPGWVSPSDGTQMSETPVLVFTMPTLASPMHFHLQLDTASSFDTGSLREAKTSTDQTGWTYWDGGTWQAVPSGGVPAIYGGNQARFAVSSPLAGGTWYRRVRAGT